MDATDWLDAGTAPAPNESDGRDERDAGESSELAMLDTGAAPGPGPLAACDASDREQPETSVRGVGAAVGTAVGPVMVTIHPSEAPFLVQRGRYFFRGDQPYYIAGAGGPEGFLYETEARQKQIVDELVAYGVNGLYFHATRAFGGDGNQNQNEHLFVSAANRTLDGAKLSRVAKVLDRLDQAGIVMWFNLLDDHAKPWGCATQANKANYANYATQLARTFKGYKHLIWVTQEEYDWGGGPGCSHGANVLLQQTLAAALRAEDHQHAVATHHMNGDSFDFAGTPDISVFGQQTGDHGEGDSVDHMHDVSGMEGWASGAAYVMAEAHPYHKTLIQTKTSVDMRRSLWATAFSGGSLYMYDAYECHKPGQYGTGAWLCSGPNAGNAPAQPTPEMLDALRRLRRFMNGARFADLAPLFGAALNQRRRGQTKWLLANDGKGSYLAYGLGNVQALGVSGAKAGTYEARWFDPQDGAPFARCPMLVVHGGGDLVVTKPAAVGQEAVLSLARQD